MLSNVFLLKARQVAFELEELVHDDFRCRPQELMLPRSILGVVLPSFPRWRESAKHFRLIGRCLDVRVEVLLGVWF